MRLHLSLAPAFARIGTFARACLRNDTDDVTVVAAVGMPLALSPLIAPAARRRRALDWNNAAGKP